MTLKKEKKKKNSKSTAPFLLSIHFRWKRTYIRDNFFWSIGPLINACFFNSRRLCLKRFIIIEKRKKRRKNHQELILIQILNPSHVVPSFRKLLVFTFDIFICTFFHLIKIRRKFYSILIYVSFLVSFSKFPKILRSIQVLCVNWKRTTGDCKDSSFENEKY